MLFSSSVSEENKTSIENYIYGTESGQLGKSRAYDGIITDIVGGSVQGGVETALSGKAPSKVKNLTVTSGTLTADDITYITGTLTGLTTLDISAATLTADQLWTLLNTSNITTLTLSNDQKALLKTLSGKTFTPALLSKTGMTAQELASGMTTSNFIVDGTTLLVTGNIDSSVDTQIASVLSDQKAAGNTITTLDVSNATNTTAYNIAAKDDITVVNLPSGDKVTYDGAATEIVDGVLTVSLGASGTYTDAAAMKSALASILPSVEHLKITGTLTAGDIDALFVTSDSPAATNVCGVTNIKTLDLSETTPLSNDTWRSKAKNNPCETAILLPKGTDFTTKADWEGWGANFYSVDNDNESQLNIVVGNAGSASEGRPLKNGSYFAETLDGIKSIKLYNGRSATGAGGATALNAYATYPGEVSLVDLTSAQANTEEGVEDARKNLAEYKVVLSPTDDDSTQLLISGRLTNDVLKTISALTKPFTSIDFSGVTGVADDIDWSLLTGPSSVKYMLVPDGTDVITIGIKDQLYGVATNNGSQATATLLKEDTADEGTAFKNLVATFPSLKAASSLAVTGSLVVNDTKNDLELSSFETTTFDFSKATLPAVAFDGSNTTSKLKLSDTQKSNGTFILPDEKSMDDIRDFIGSNTALTAYSVKSATKGATTVKTLNAYVGNYNDVSFASVAAEKGATGLVVAANVTKADEFTTLANAVKASNAVSVDLSELTTNQGKDFSAMANDATKYLTLPKNTEIDSYTLTGFDLNAVAVNWDANQKASYIVTETKLLKAGTLAGAELYVSETTMRSQRNNFFGTMNTDDLAAMANNHNAIMDFGGVSFEGGANAGNTFLSNFSNNSVRFLRLPDGLSISNTDMASLKTGEKNTGLLMVGLADASGSSCTDLKLHSYASNNNAEFMGNNGSITDVDGNTITFSESKSGNGLFTSERTTAKTISMSGLYGDHDLVDGASGNLYSKVNTFDFTGATFDEDVTVPTITSTNSYHVNEDGTFDDDEFSERASATLKCTKTNAFYYISDYAAKLKAIKFPTGNSVIPPKSLSGLGTNVDGESNVEVDLFIPSNITEIAFEAFHQARIKTLTFEGGKSGVAAGIKTIGPGAFNNPTVLTDVAFTGKISDVKIQQGAFTQCNVLKHLSLPEGIVSLGQNVFDNSQELESIRLPETLTKIGNGCFNLATRLMGIAIPSNVEKIGKSAFSLTALKDVYLTTTDPEKLPVIWTMGTYFESGDINSTFGANTLVNNTSDGVGFNSGGNETDYDWNNGTDQYYFSNMAAVLHYPKQLAEAVLAKISEDYGYTSTVDGSKFPKRNAGDYARRAMSITSNLSYDAGTGYSGTQAYSDLGSAGTGNYTAHGWAQFALMEVYDPSGDTEEEIFTKLYDDVWNTMCFPFDLTDEQLAGAFNEGFNIVDFSGVTTEDNEITGGTNLILHFNTIANTVYKDQFDNHYARVKVSGENKIVNGEKVYVRYSKYFGFEHKDNVLDNSKEYTFQEIVSGKKTKTFKADGDTQFYIIEGILGEAGHPYLVHPNIGFVDPNDKKPGNFINVSWKNPSIIESSQFYSEDYRSKFYVLEGSKYVRKSTDEAGTSAADEQAFVESWRQTNYCEKEKIAHYVDNDAEKGVYTFAGNVENNGKKIPKYSYFLGRKTGEYPKFYREMAEGEANTKGFWTQYTAIVTPDAEAIEKIEKQIVNRNETVTTAKMSFFDDYYDEVVTLTAIESIAAEAASRGEKVEHLNIVYSINGQVVKTGDRSLEQLPKGIYIVNGKKYLVK